MVINFHSHPLAVSDFPLLTQVAHNGNVDCDNLYAVVVWHCIHTSLDNFKILVSANDRFPYARPLGFYAGSNLAGGSSCIRNSFVAVRIV